MPPSPLKYPGGKSYLAEWLVGLFPARDEYITYVDVFGGGGSVLLAHDPDGKAEIYNDLDGALTEFWSVLQSDTLYPEFAHRCAVTPFSEREFNFAVMILSQPDLWSVIDRAHAYFVRCRQSLMGMGKSFTPLTTSRTRRGMGEQASAWLSAVEGLPAVHERLKRVQILARDGVEVIRQFDKWDCLLYCDPPYHPDTRAGGLYAVEMTAADHTRFVDALLSATAAKVLVSGYACDEYARLEKAGWERIDRAITNAMSVTDTKPTRTESVWRNFRA